VTLSLVSGLLAPSGVQAQNLFAGFLTPTLVDNDTSGGPTPGDDLDYQLLVSNNAATTATGTFVTIPAFPNTTLDATTVPPTSTAGTVTLENGNTSIRVDIGDLTQVQGIETITFRVRIDDPLANQENRVNASARIVAGTGVTPPEGGDPVYPFEANAAVTTVIEVPQLEATLVASLLVDGNGNGGPDPGDTLEYKAQILERNGFAAANVTIDIPAITGGTLQVGTLVVSNPPASVINTGATAGDNSVNVSVASLPASTGVTLTYQVQIDASPGVTQLTAQGTVGTDGFTPAILTHYPDGIGDPAPTVTPLADPELTATLTAALLVDGGTTGIVDPGDTIRYTAVLTETNAVDATGVAFTLTPLANTSLIVGTVTSTQGVITSGMSSGDTSVSVSVGGVTGSGTVTITFDVTIADPVGRGALEVSNQGTVSATGLADVLTDDPAASGTADPTRTALSGGGATNVGVTMVDAIVAGGTGVTAGGTIRYTVTVAELDGLPAHLAVFSLPAITDTTLVAGSVTTTQGTVTTGNTGGDTTISVALGSLPARSSATITFDLLVDAVPVGSQVSAQGSVAGNNFPTVSSNDSPGGGATVTPIVTAGIDATLTYSVNDTNSNGGLDLGERIDFTVVITKNGAADVTSVVFTLPPITGLLAAGFPAATTSQGTIVHGAGGVTATVGTMTSASGPVTITFSYNTHPFVPPTDPTQIPVQGTVASSLPTINTDDPATAAVDDATVIPVGASPALTATLTDALQVDANGNGLADAGDRIRYTATITETNSAAATSIVFTHPAIAETTLVAGVVTTSQGTVDTGNTGGDTTVQVSVGTLNGGSAVITFDVDVNASLTPGVNQVSAQGTVASADVATLQTDDTAVGGATDPTVTQLVNPAATADIFATMTAPSPVNPGDAHTYTVIISERSGNPSLGTTFTIGVIPNAALVDGSVTTTQGTVTTGNGGSDTTVEVDVGDMAGSGTVTITFQTTIANPVPPGTLQISAQGTVQGTNFTTVQTQDPVSGGATVTPLAGPLLEATLTDALQNDADGDGRFSPGDTIRYTAVVSNTGTAGATSVVFTHPAIANATLVDGNVTTTAGTIDVGNGGGPDTTVQVTLGSLANSASETITFDVLIDSPIAGGVTELSAQGSVSAANALTASTDDPAAAGLGTDPTISSLDYVDVTFTLVDALFADGNGDGNADPGETLRYTAALDTSGTRTLSAAVFTLTPDASTTLLPGLVTTTKGTVTTGNTGGDTTIAIALGDVTPTDTVTVQFQVQINTPLGGAVTQVSQQATLSVTGRSPDLSDDPDVGGASDPTVTPIVRPVLSATLVDALQVDSNSDGLIGPGDTLRYTAVVSNTGNQGATSVVFTHPVVANASLVDGTVTATAGTIDVGNGGGPDTTVQVTLGAMANGASETITFDVLIDSPIAAGTAQLSAQGSVTAANAPTASTDDLAVGGATDPTITPLDYVVETLTLVDALLVDGNADGNADPGETLSYTAVLDTTGTRNLTAAIFSLTPDANTTLVAGTVTTSLGTVTTGNTGGDTTVAVSVGTVTTTDVVTIQFQVTVNAGIGPTVQQVSQQGTLNSTGRPALSSDDPAVGGTADATLTSLPRPTLAGTLVATLQNDLDTDAIVDPGDTLRYTAVITNSGLQAGDTVVFALTPEANTLLQVGSVTTSVGTVTTGNTGGDTTVSVAVGALAATSSVTITFDAVVRLPFPKTPVQVSNQGTVTSATFPTFSTDDPGAGGAADPTVTAVTRLVAPSATLTDTLVVDLDGDSVTDPGDSLSYTLVVTGGGDTVADTVNLTLAPDVNTTLDVGTVTTSQGAVTTGNTAGDTTIAVAIAGRRPGRPHRGELRAPRDR
jgi:uncharacterized repeat protein (TIGR01451 family)